MSAVDRLCYSAFPFDYNSFFFLKYVFSERHYFLWSCDQTADTAIRIAFRNWCQIHFRCCSTPPPPYPHFFLSNPYIKDFISEEILWVSYYMQWFFQISFGLPVWNWGVSTSGIMMGVQVRGYGWGNCPQEVLSLHQNFTNYCSIPVDMAGIW